MTGKKIFCILALGGSFLSYGQDFFTYRVKEQDTRWRIVQDFGITLDSFAVLNPSLSSDPNSLPLGALIQLPKPEGFHPSITQREVLKAMAPINTTLYHTVKPKETFFDIVRKYGTTYRDLLAMNSGLELVGLQPGMKIKAKKLDSVDTYYEAEYTQSYSWSEKALSKTYKIVYALPFRIDKMNFLDSIIAHKTIEARTDMKLSLNFYQGALFAIERLRNMGISVEAFPIDTQLNSFNFSQRLSEIDSIESDALVGPLSERCFKVAVNYARKKNIPVVFPAAASSDETYENAYYPVPDEKLMRNRILRLSQLKYSNEKVLIIADQENREAANDIKEVYPFATEVALIKEVSVDIDTLSTQLDSLKPNWVFVETRNLKLASSVSSILASSIRDSVRIKMFTTNRNAAFENDIIDNQQLTQLAFSFPSFYKHLRDDSFSKEYEQRFGLYPDRFALRGFDLTMDLVLRLLHTESDPLKNTPYITHLIDYQRDSLRPGFYNRASVIMRYEDMDVKQFD